MTGNTKPNLLEGYLIEQTAKKMKWSFAQELANRDIEVTVDQWIILDTLLRYGSSSQQELSIKTDKDAPTVTRMLDLMEKKELVRRVGDPKDRRRFLISLTQDGKKMSKRIQPISQKFRSKCYDGLSEKEIVLLKKTLHTITSNLND